MNESKRRRLLEIEQAQAEQKELPNVEMRQEDRAQALIIVNQILNPFQHEDRLQFSAILAAGLIAFDAPTLLEALEAADRWAHVVRRNLTDRWPAIEAARLAEAQRRMGERAMGEAMEIAGMTKQ